MHSNFIQQENQSLFADSRYEDDHKQNDLDHGSDSEYGIAFWNDDCTDFNEEAEQEETQRRFAREQIFIDSLEADAKERPIDTDEEEEPERRQLKRDLQKQALKRIEDAARTQRDFENVIAWWDRLDANRQRKERYHEICRSGDDIPLDYRALEDALYFPDTLNNALQHKERKGDFTDSIFYCPLDIHQLVTEEYLSKILRELPEEHKFLLSFWALRQLSSTQIATIRGQSDRNIRKVRRSMLKKIRKKLLSVLTEKAHHQPLTLTEKRFLSENGGVVYEKVI